MPGASPALALIRYRWTGAGAALTFLEFSLVTNASLAYAYVRRRHDALPPLELDFAPEVEEDWGE